MSTHFTQICLLRLNHGLALAAILTQQYIHNEPPHTVQRPYRYSFIYYIYIYTHTYIDIQNIYIYSQKNKQKKCLDCIRWRSERGPKNTVHVRVQTDLFTLSLKGANERKTKIQRTSVLVYILQHQERREKGQKEVSVMSTSCLISDVGFVSFPESKTKRCLSRYSNTVLKTGIFSFGVKYLEKFLACECCKNEYGGFFSSSK